ncbi:MAG TPA: 4Fe-4S dicluster domain-containing protein [Rhodanobacteraceae bacterium]|nr:4Fe-4S dicluster domain-containing protein [Rhodanobacteraceae bacterium]
MTFADRPAQQPCTHCGECVRACPETLDPEALFFALVDDDWPVARAARLDACTECNRCVEVCPSHIPLLDWFRWGKAERAAQDQAGLARARFEARNTRLARQRGGRARQRGSARDPVATTAPARTISKQDVLAAIARGRAKVRAIVPDRRTTKSPAIPDNKNP